MAVGILTIVIYCLLNAVPHFLYGPGEDALSLTVEHGGVKDDDKTKAVQEMDNNLLVCQRNGNYDQHCMTNLSYQFYQPPETMLFPVREMMVT